MSAPVAAPARGYRGSQKLLHWLTVGAVVAQFAVGYNLDLDDGGADCDPPGEERSGGDTTDAFEDRLDRLEEACEARAAELHLALGLTVLVLGVLRPLVRKVAGLPPWAEQLSAGQRRLAGVTEKSLMLLLVLVPLSGLLLVGTGDDAWLPLHVGAHVAFFAALAAHLVTNLRPAILRRML